MLSQKIHHQHERIHSYSQQQNGSRLLAYNQLIEFARKIIDELSTNYRMCDLAVNEIKIIDGSAWAIIYEEDLGYYYWIAMSDKGVLVDGWSMNYSGDYVCRRIVRLDTIINCGCMIAQCDACYSDDGRLDFDTLKRLCVGLIRLCYDLKLRDFIDSVKNDHVDFLIEESGLS